ncbi:MAG TPA: Fe2+-dependent dioxygenase, partial [Ramlibacter sp.]|nr:Fe2+-dependent dioxygenase [Ramlibacter sp.]
MLLTFPLLDESELRQARSLLETAPWTDGRSTAGSQAVQAKSNEQLPHDCKASRALQSMVQDALDRSPRFLSAALPRRLFPPRFNRYSGSSNFYGKHVDGAVRFTEDGGRVRTDLSCTLFLSDLTDYDGGELVNEHSFGQQRVKLAAGDLVLYPGTSVHRVEPVT